MAILFYVSWGLLLFVLLCPFYINPTFSLLSEIYHNLFTNDGTKFISVFDIILSIVSIGCFVAALVLFIKHKKLASFITLSANFFVLLILILRSHLNPKNIGFSDSVSNIILSVLIYLCYLGAFACILTWWIKNYVHFPRRPTKAERLEARVAELEQQVEDLKKGD